jgi:hypothetical protein
VPASSPLSARQALANCSTFSPDPRPIAALIDRLSLRADGEWLVELLIDLEEDEPARLLLVEALRRTV